MDPHLETGVQYILVHRKIDSTAEYSIPKSNFFVYNFILMLIYSGYYFEKPI